MTELLLLARNFRIELGNIGKVGLVFAPRRFELLARTRRALLEMDQSRPINSRIGKMGNGCALSYALSRLDRERSNIARDRCGNEDRRRIDNRSVGLVGYDRRHDGGDENERNSGCDQIRTHAYDVASRRIGHGPPFTIPRRETAVNATLPVLLQCSLRMLRGLLPSVAALGGAKAAIAIRRRMARGSHLRSARGADCPDCA